MPLTTFFGTIDLKGTVEIYESGITDEILGFLMKKIWS